MAELYVEIKRALIHCSMKAILVYNEYAGFRKASTEEVKNMLEDAGFETSCISLQGKEFSELKKQGCDLVVAVGGDGTVKAVALQLAGSAFPMAIWPTGTANNIASSFGIRKGPAFNLLKALSLQQLKAGEVRMQGMSHSFMESAGVGLLSCMMGEMIHKVFYGNEQEKLNKSIVLLQKLLRNKKEYEVGLSLDGESFTGRYLAIEVLNTRYTGPKLMLAPQRKADSQKFDVVLISLSQAQQLERYFSDRLAGLQRPPQLPVYPAELLTIRGKGLDFHIDDALFHLTEETVVHIRASEQGTKIYSPD